MHYFQAQLIKVDSKPDQKTGRINHRLIFKSQRFDRGLEEMVDCSQAIKLEEDHFYLLDTYLNYRGRDLCIPIALMAVDGNVYLKTAQDGKPRDLSEKTVTNATTVKTAGAPA